ncbi:hypothetical protein GYB29_05425 [bacterium]|nr:hypothetical protein [bacterium]
MWYTILALAFLLRVLLFVFNTDYNDDHVTPVLMWLESGVYPAVHDCWECFQPKGFYALVKFTAELFNLSSFSAVRFIFELYNTLLSLLVLFILFKVHISIKSKSIIVPLLFAFWALNPKLIAIGAQATNDMFIIAGGIVFTLLVNRFFVKKLTWSILMGTAVFVFLLAIGKGNGLVIAAVFLCLLIYQLFRRSSLNLKMGSFVLMILLPVLIAKFGGYYDKYLSYGDPFIINQDKASKPHWNQEDDFQGRMGVRTIKSAYFSFELESLIEEPYNINSGDEYPKHRESFFTQLYGQFSHILFERHPASWISFHPDMLNFARANYLVLLPLLLIFIASIFSNLLHGIHSLIRNGRVNLSLFHALFSLTFIVFTLKYSMDYRDFSNMKVIFFFPALISMSYCFNEVTIAKFNNVVVMLLLSLASLLFLLNTSFLVIHLA